MYIKLPHYKKTEKQRNTYVSTHVGVRMEKVAKAQYKTLEHIDYFMGGIDVNQR